jgi:AcrR family transcriptional regulator
MARTVNQAEHNAKRNEILDAAQRLVYTKGYERMTVQDILVDLGISSGAFYHYFSSKPAVLEALIERMQQEAEQPLLPLVHDPHLSALEKLQRFFATLDRSRIVQKAFIADLLRVWFADDNAIVRQKVDEAIFERRAPLLNLIVRQGIQEGVFTTLYPDHASEIILSIAQGMERILTGLMLAYVQKPGEPRLIDDIVAAYAACIDAIERVLGAPSGFLVRPDAGAVKQGLVLSEDTITK